MEKIKKALLVIGVALAMIMTVLSVIMICLGPATYVAIKLFPLLGLWSIVIGLIIAFLMIKAIEW